MSHHLRLHIQPSRAMEASSSLLEGGYVQLQTAKPAWLCRTWTWTLFDKLRHPESKALARLASVARRYDAVDCTPPRCLFNGHLPLQRRFPGACCEHG